MRGRLTFALIAAAFLAGCGSPHNHPGLPVPPRFVCHHKVPAQAGECIRQELQARRLEPVAPTRTFGGAFAGQCIDISRYQPFPDWPALRREGIRCVIIQTSYGTSPSNPYFGSQVRGAHASGLLIGVYAFVLDESGEAQANVMRQVAAPYMSLIALGGWADTEVPGSYEHACTIVFIAQRSFRIAGVYASPGNYSGGRCGYSWPAEWGGGAPYPLPGFSASSIVLRQWCGTCFLNGMEVDRDEDRGLIALARPPESPAQRRAKLRRERTARLHRDYRTRRALDGQLRKLNCLHGYHHYTRRHRAACTSYRARHGIVSRDIKRLHRLGIR